jgi:predicted membrane protein
MIIFTILGILTALFFFVVIIMAILESKAKRIKKDKILWNMDKVETLTGGLAHDRNRTYSEIQKGNEKQ